MQGSYFEKILLATRIADEHCLQVYKIEKLHIRDIKNIFAICKKINVSQRHETFLYLLKYAKET